MYTVHTFPYSIYLSFIYENFLLYVLDFQVTMQRERKPKHFLEKKVIYYLHTCGVLEICVVRKLGPKNLETWSETWVGGLWIWSQFSCLYVHVSTAISQTCLDRFYLYLAQQQHKTVHICMPYFFENQIQDGRLAANLVVKKPDVEHVLNHLLDMHVPMLFKLGTQIKNDGLHKSLIFFFHKIRSKMANWQPFCYLNMSTTISLTFMVQFCSNLAQAQ